MIIDGCKSPRNALGDVEFDVLSHRKVRSEALKNGRQHNMTDRRRGEVRRGYYNGIDGGKGRELESRIVGFGSSNWERDRRQQHTSEFKRTTSERPRSSTPFEKLTPTEKLRRNFDGRNRSPLSPVRARSYDKLRYGMTSNGPSSTRSSTRPRNVDKRRPRTPTKPRSIDQNRVITAPSRRVQQIDRPISVTRRTKSFEVKYSNSQLNPYFNNHRPEDRTRRPKSPGRHSRLLDHTEKEINRKRFDAGSHYSSGRNNLLARHSPPQREFGDRHRGTVSGDNTTRRFETTSPTLFPHTKSQSYVRAVNSEVVDDEVSDLSNAFSEFSPLRARKQPAKAAERRNTPTEDLLSTFSSLQGSERGNHNEPRSPTSVGSTGDRYTTFDDDDDSFDEAARSRLGSRSSLVFERVSPITNSYLGDFVVSKSSIDQRDDIESPAKSRLLNPRFKSTIHKAVVPGLTIGQSRSFVDQVEDQLGAIKHKREAEQMEDSFRISTPTKVSNQPSGARPHFGPKSPIGRVENERKSRLGSILCLVGCRERNIATASSLRTSPKGSDGGAFDVMNTTSLNPERGMSGNENDKVLLVADGNRRGWFRRKAPVGSCMKVSQTAVVDASGRAPTSNSSGRHKSKPRSSATKNGRGGSTGSNEHSQGSSVTAEQSDVISYCVEEPMTSFDRALQRRPEQAPDVEFAIVELGQDENTEKAHSTIVNKNEVQKVLTSLKHQLRENEDLASMANTHKLTAASAGTTDPSHVKVTRDDVDLDEVNLTESFANQLLQLKQLHKPPYKVPRGAYML